MPPSPPPHPARRWLVVGLLFLAMVLSYVDHQTIGLLKGDMSKAMHWSNSDYANIHICFQAAYAVCYLLWGRIVDRIGAKIGLALAFSIWTVTQIATAGAGRISQFMLARGALGVGESGAFPAAIKAITLDFSQKERAFASGLFNSGSNIGAIVTPLIVPMVAVAWGWQAAFVVTGAAGLVFLPLWLWLYRPSQVAAENTPKPLPWLETLKRRQAWAYGLGKMLTDPVFGMYLVWLPDFLMKRYHLDLKGIGLPLAMIYLLSDAGSVSGGWLSSSLIRRGVSVNVARKATLIACAACATPVVLAPMTGQLWLTVAIIGLAAAAHQGFSATLYALPGDLVPARGVATVTGLGGLLGAGAGIAMSKYTGYVLDAGLSYLPVFMVCAAAYWCAALVIHLLSPGLEPFAAAE